MNSRKCALALSSVGNLRDHSSPVTYAASHRRHRHHHHRLFVCCARIRLGGKPIKYLNMSIYFIYTFYTQPLQLYPFSGETTRERNIYIVYYACEQTCAWNREPHHNTINGVVCMGGEAEMQYVLGNIVNGSVLKWKHYANVYDYTISVEWKWKVTARIQRSRDCKICARRAAPPICLLV